MQESDIEVSAKSEIETTERIMVTGSSPVGADGSTCYPQTGIVGTVCIPPRPGTVVVPCPTMVKGPPTDMTSLLRACTELGQSSGGITKTSDEDKHFLERAIFQDFTNTADDMKTAIATLKDVFHIDGYWEKQESHLNALEILIDLVDDIDSANAFLKLDNMTTCFNCMASPSPEIRAAAMTLMAEVVQNNPKAQETYRHLNVIYWIMPKFRADHEVPMVKEKAFHAVSCYLRDHPKAIKHFLEEWELSFIFDLTLKTDNINILKRCRYILHTIYHCEEEEGRRAAKVFLTRKETINFCRQLIARLRKTSCVPTRNIILHIISSIFAAEADLHEEFLSPKLGLVPLIKEYLGEYENVQDPYYSPDAGELYDVLLELQGCLKLKLKKKKK